MITLIKILMIAVVLFAGRIYAQTGHDERSTDSSDGQNWTHHWALEANFAIGIDTEGYHFPSAIAFVPSPGNEPHDPLYFVTELRGTIKVITNDRTVHTFYTFSEAFFRSEFYNKIPISKYEFGMAGICLEPEHGYVFVTFTYRDSQNILRNNVMRFVTRPQTFAIQPRGKVAFTDVFAPYESGASHQIGACQIYNKHLYISIGDGFKSPLEAQNLDSMLGKIIRMDFEGQPVPANPFYEGDNILRARNYVWAYGLRNPFGQKIVKGKVLVAENGINIDRFLKVEQGQNYLWDGRDTSIAANATYVFAPALAPVQIDYVAGDSNLLPDAFQPSVFVALAPLGKGKHPGVYRIPYDIDQDRLTASPQYFVKHVGTATQMVTGLAFGPDGLYFVPIRPFKDGKSAVLKVIYTPGYTHAATLSKSVTADQILRSSTLRDFLKEKGCNGCHRIKDLDDQGGTKGPELDRGDGPMVSRIKARLDSPEYVQSLEKLDQLDQEPMKRFRGARHQVLNAKGLEQVKLWLKYHILEPRFANPYSIMPNMGLTDGEATVIANSLLVKVPKQSLKAKMLRMVQKVIPKPNYKAVFVAFVSGLVVATILSMVLRKRA